MLDPQLVLSTGNRPPPALNTTSRCALVVGAGGVLGSSVMEQLLASHRFVRVAALVHRPVQAAVHGFVAVNNDAASLQALAADTALVVFDRVRQAFQREAAFVVPQPQQLPQLAVQLLAAGVRRLIVVMPHRAALLPMALQQGLATLDEAAVSALGFEQLVFMRMAQHTAGDADAGGTGTWRDSPQRLALWLLSQLHWMTPQREQPVQHATVAKVAASLAVQLPQAPAATRVLPAQLLWHAAQQRQVHDTVQAWLDGTPLPPLPAQKRMRM
jgi:hypothetical protein